MKYLLLFALFAISVTSEPFSLEEHQKRQLEILSKAPLFDKLGYMNVPWKQQLKHEFETFDPTKREIKGYMSVFRTKPDFLGFRGKLKDVSAWLKQSGINEPETTALTQNLGTAVSSDGTKLTMKSSEWILANIMHDEDIKPQYIVDVLSLGRMKNAPLLEVFRRGSKKFFILDDASYSGNQIKNMINALEYVAKENNQVIEIFVALPYLSQVAKNEFGQKKFKHVKINLYPDFETIPVVSPDCSYYAYEMDVHLFAFQHKSPDFVSVVPHLSVIADDLAKKLYHGKPFPPYKDVPI